VRREVRPLNIKQVTGKGEIESAKKARVPKLPGVVGTLAFFSKSLGDKMLRLENERECQIAASLDDNFICF
jgi:hypothetical protein